VGWRLRSLSHGQTRYLPILDGRRWSATQIALPARKRRRLSEAGNIMDNGRWQESLVGRGENVYRVVAWNLRPKSDSWPTQWLGSGGDGGGSKGLGC
jgi:hypothetical protein